MSLAHTLRTTRQKFVVSSENLKTELVHNAIWQSANPDLALASILDFLESHADCLISVDTDLKGSTTYSAYRPVVY